MNKRTITFILSSIFALIIILNFNLISSTANVDSKSDLAVESVDLKPCDCPEGYTSIVEVSDPDASTYDLCSCSKVTGFNPTGSCKGEC